MERRVQKNLQTVKISLAGLGVLAMALALGLVMTKAISNTAATILDSVDEKRLVESGY